MDQLHTGDPDVPSAVYLSAPRSSLAASALLALSATPALHCVSAALTISSEGKGHEETLVKSLPLARVSSITHA